MRIDKLVLENFRCFRSLTLELHPEFTLIIGTNGAGKTSLLEGLSVAVGAWMGGFPDLRERPIHRNERRVQRVDVGGIPSIETCFPTSVAATGFHAGNPLEWVTSPPTPGIRRSRNPPEGIRKLSAVAQQEVSAGVPVDLPVLVYYGAGRLWLSSLPRHHPQKARQPVKLGSRLEGYEDCFTPAPDQRRFEHWMEWRETIRLERLAADPTATNGKIADPHLEGVQEAAKNCVEGARRVFFSFQHRELRIEFEDGRILPFGMLSDGYRNLIAVAADIAWRAVRLNPQHGRDAAALAEGVVLIDEIDLHLHPAWQRRVIGDLRRTFPRIQFVATTHSPQVVSSAKSEWLRLLTPKGEIRRIQHGEGRDSNSLLEDIFGAPSRPVEATEQIGRLFERIDAMDWVEAEAAWARLHAFLGPDDPDVIRARALMDLERGLGLVPAVAEKAGN